MGDYELLDLLHESEDTQTFVARQRSIDRTVALVLLKAHRRADPDAVEAFGRGSKPRRGSPIRGSRRSTNPARRTAGSTTRERWSTALI